MLRKRLAAAVFAALVVLAPAAGARAQGAAQIAALAAASEGRPQEALALARALLLENPGDAFAHYVIGTVMLWQGQSAEAMQAGARAFHAAGSKVQRHESARLVASAAMQAEKPLLARYWLRHAASTAPDALRRAGAERALAQLRAATPWSAGLRFGIQPSSNVNAGASSRLNVIEGVPLVGVLSDAALALPGLVGTLEARLGYRLRADADSQTELSARLYLRAVELSGTPTTTTMGPSGAMVETEIANSSLAAGSAELGLRHSFAASGNARIGLDLGLGRAWSAGAFAYDYLRLGADRGPVAAGVFYGAGWEWRSAADPRRDQTIATLRGGWRGAFANGDRLVLSLGLRHVASESVNARGSSVSAELSYQPARQIGPAAVTANFGLSYADYPDYTLGFLAVPGGRQETLGFAELELWLPDKSYAGFSPQIKLRALETRSNVSSFARRELSLSIGFRSNF
jgi:hypothetical protein